MQAFTYDFFSEFYCCMIHISPYNPPKSKYFHLKTFKLKEINVCIIRIGFLHFKPVLHIVGIIFDVGTCNVIQNNIRLTRFPLVHPYSHIPFPVIPQ
jgi:hypothetical protein